MAAKGKGTPGTLLTADEDAERRRASKRHPRRKRGGFRHTETLIAGLEQDREALQEDRRIAREKRLEAEREFRKSQSELALGLLDPELKDLARKVAELVIEFFPTSERTSDMSYTQAAVARMHTRLTDDELQRTRAINMGTSRAYTALGQAFETLRAHPGSVHD